MELLLGAGTSPSLVSSSLALTFLQISLPLHRARSLSDAGPAQPNDSLDSTYCMRSPASPRRACWPASAVRHSAGTPAAYGPPMTSPRYDTPRPICKQRLWRDASSSKDRCDRRHSPHRRPPSGPHHHPSSLQPFRPPLRTFFW